MTNVHPRLQAELEDRLEFETLISDLSARMVMAPPDEVDVEVERGLAGILRFFRCDRCGMLEVGSEADYVHVSHISVAEGVPGVPKDLNLAALFPWVRDRALVKRQSVVVSKMSHLPEEAAKDRSSWEALGIKSDLIIPLQTGPDIRHIIVLNSLREEREWPDSYIPRVRLLGEIFANAIERTRSAKALRQSELRLNLAADAAGAALWVLNPGDDVFWVSAKAREIFGVSPTFEFTVREFLGRVHPQDLERVSAALKEALAEKREVDLEYRIVRDDGQVRWVASRGRQTAGTDGTAERLMGVTVDVTDQKMAEQEAHDLRRDLSHVARVAMMGEISAAIAHELSQPLTAILSNAQVAQRMLEGGSPDLGEVREILADIISDDQRAAAVIRSLRAFLAKNQPEIQPLDLVEVIREVNRHLRHEAALRSVPVEVRCDSAPALVRGDRIQLQQVLVNLMVNALDAARDLGGREPHITVQTERAADGAVRVSVLDNGLGIPEGQSEKIFEPYFTDKPGGLGMGLAISRSILRAHGGRIWAENVPGGGAKFSFELPADGGERG